jgi:serine/threonine protein kinase
MPYNFTHNLHINLDLEWENIGNPTEIFLIAEKLGQGSFGSVYKAIHRPTGIELAIKEIKDVGSHGDAASEIKNEIEILKKCQHPCIVSYFGTVRNGSDMWVRINDAHVAIWAVTQKTALTWLLSQQIIMDYCALGSIRDMMITCNSPLTEQQIKFVAFQTVKSLIYLHSRDIIHRDVKAANILLNEGAQVKIADFGVSNRLQNLNRVETAGTPLWMSPEVIQKKPYDSKVCEQLLGITSTFACLQLTVNIAYPISVIFGVWVLRSWRWAMVLHPTLSFRFSELFVW